ncbi:TFIID-18kDa-domain-containing protein [Conidiobolus coronatus NRRL 28638]|uniref:TFIID-18kDa-domain-containing protein n=1 Tax=Conidiobolus coronatus (strain ATCC 28846 / CBS 209.66 / NRRL 28638) TaxID=796925 RepID=A0A137P547_CONC2|nr:TFIID-18kDa-domain-containing protein [Conidiobolus coronatus NRRL 28638]|eukprot:KXN70137.1 TFIID-18kDa-domain-containing protein [Conidiobolus coronatus NRRL 28638]
MLYVFGEVPDPLLETTMLIEDIVRSQVIEILILIDKQLSAKGSKAIVPEDLIFLIRHDRAKVNRLRVYLSWKDIRKNAKEGTDPVGGTGEDLLEDNIDKPQKVKKMRIKLSWELANSFLDVIPSDSEDEDEDSIEAYRDSMLRLRHADNVTRVMSKDEYVHYSECRQASFTFRKAKKFKDWCHMSTYTDSKPNDDIIDILGFLTFEMVSNLTECALRVKSERELQIPSESPNGLIISDTSDTGKVSSLFSAPKADQTPLQPVDIHEAFRRLQRKPLPLKNYLGGLVRTRVSLI